MGAAGVELKVETEPQVSREAALMSSLLGPRNKCGRGPKTENARR